MQYNQIEKKHEYFLEICQGEKRCKIKDEKMLEMKECKEIKKEQL